MTDPHDLERFVSAQGHSYETALAELKRGRKTSHWIWYIFPQVAGLGFSPIAQNYAIQCDAEARAYLEHPSLGPHLTECAQALLEHKGESIDRIMGYPDNLKLCSSMTLFASVSPEESIFHQVIDCFFDGAMDSRTIDFLKKKP